jgi:hypothetical protein
MSRGKNEYVTPVQSERLPPFSGPLKKLASTPTSLTFDKLKIKSYYKD